MGGELSGYNSVQHFLVFNIAKILHAGLEATIYFKLQFLAIYRQIIHSGQIEHTKILSNNFHLFLEHSNKILPPNIEINDVKKIFFLIIQILKVIFIHHSNKEDQLSTIKIRMYNRVTLVILPLVFCSPSSIR